jgi:hypothetical protein
VIERRQGPPGEFDLRREPLRLAVCMACEQSVQVDPRGGYVGVRCDRSDCPTKGERREGGSAT